MSSRRFLALLFLAACGGGGGSGDSPDARDPDSGGGAIDMAPNPVTCAYTEAADATNNTSPTAEATGVSAAAPVALCGKVNNGHYNGATTAVDIDTFKVTLPAEADILVHLTGAGLSGLQVARLQVGTTAGMQRKLAVFDTDHATLSVHLPAGDYVFAVTGFNGADIAAPIDYKVVIVPDQPATRCAKVTAAPTFTEANDGAVNTGNDMLTVDESSDPTTNPTPGNTDNPEPTAITTAAGTSYRIGGSSADVDLPDDYEDRDTFLFTTGATTNQLSVRLNWPSTTVDFDFKVFPANTVLSVAGGLATKNSEEELETFAVRPNTQYWLWVGAYDGATGQPAAYDATICAETFTP